MALTYCSQCHYKLNPISLYIKLLINIIFLLSALIVLSLFNPVNNNFYPLCIFKSLTGLQCGGCGSLRGIHQLLNGNYVSALYYNPVTFLFTLPLLAQSLIQSSLPKSLQERIPNYFSSSKRTYFFIVVLIGYGIIRNIPNY